MWRFILSIVAFSPGLAVAADLRFEPAQLNLGVGEVAQVEVFLSDIEEPIGALSGTLTLPSDLVLIESVHADKSVVSWWVEEPNVAQNTVSFVGMIPHGFVGALSPSQSGSRRGSLLTLQVRATATTTTSLRGVDFEAYNVSSTPEPIIINTADLPIRVSGSDFIEPVDIARQDFTPPEFTHVDIMTDAQLFDGSPALIFRTKDKGSGVWYVEFSADQTTWQRITSPHQLPAGSGTRLGMIKVVDRAGNSTTTEIALPAIEGHAESQISWWWMLSGLGIVYVLYILFKKGRSSRDTL